MPFGLLELSFLSCPLPQIEEIVTLIQDETEGVPIRTVKSFMTKIPSVVTGKTPPPLTLFPAVVPGCRARQTTQHAPQTGSVTFKLVKKTDAFE